MAQAQAQAGFGDVAEQVEGAVVAAAEAGRAQQDEAARRHGDFPFAPAAAVVAEEQAGPARERHQGHQAAVADVVPVRRDADGADRLVTFNITASPFKSLETLSAANGMERDR